MTDPTPLSPAAQAVLDACLDENCGDVFMPSELCIIAAALRAVADLVVPSDADEPRNYLPVAIECQRIRAEILAIAAELNGGAQ